MDLDFKQLKLFLLPGKNPPQEFQSVYDGAYRCWREGWLVANNLEMNHHAPLYSDNFTRQDEVLALFNGEECLGVTFFRWVDFTQGATKHDSYFEHWTELSLRKLLEKGPKIMLISQFTINLKYRKNALGLSLRDLLVGLCYERFIHAQCDAGAAALRIQKHMEEAVSKVGATTLARNMPYDFNQRVDLVGYFHDQIHPSTVPGIADLVASIFPKVISLVHPIQSSNKEVKRAA